MSPGLSRLKIHRVRRTEVRSVVPLFEAYRRFYRRTSDPVAAYRYLSERIARDQAIIFVARERAEPLGFTLIYPTFSSLALRPLWILNDLYVRPVARRRGIARQLLDRAVAEARAARAAGLILDTARTNRGAQRLYSTEGWVRDEKFLHYELSLKVATRRSPSGAAIEPTAPSSRNSRSRRNRPR